jgi:hypothetical protein
MQKLMTTIGIRLSPLVYEYSGQEVSEFEFEGIEDGRLRSNEIPGLVCNILCLITFK